MTGQCIGHAAPPFWTCPAPPAPPTLTGSYTIRFKLCSNMYRILLLATNPVPSVLWIRARCVPYVQCTYI
jgi:hypothetical protein